MHSSNSGIQRLEVLCEARLHERERASQDLAELLERLAQLEQASERVDAHLELARRELPTLDAVSNEALAAGRSYLQDLEHRHQLLTARLEPLREQVQEAQAVLRKRSIEYETVRAVLMRRARRRAGEQVGVSEA